MALTVDPSTEALRKKTLETAQRHKASWIELGQYLFSIQKDKLYKNWNYLSFETYCRKELGIKETTTPCIQEKSAEIPQVLPGMVNIFLLFGKKSDEKGGLISLLRGSGLPPMEQ